MSNLGDNGEAEKMSARSGQDSLQLHNMPQPRLLSQQSISVPSTPRQQPRDFAFDVRSTSPGEGLARDSPRSVASESSRSLPAFRAVSPNCRYMSTQTSRRRIPYTIGTDRLEKEEKVKTSLEPDDEKRLSDDMHALYNRLLPTQDSQHKRQLVVEKLQRILSEAWPGKSIQVAVFGSSGNMLFTSRSDVDVCVTMGELQTTCALADLLAKSGMQKVICVHAKAVPIVKIWDPELKLACDLNVNNQVAVKNTQLVKTYIELDERVRPIAMVVKHWSKKRVINEASGGTLSSYTWTLLLINFLQTREPPVLPRIPLIDDNGQTRNHFSDDLEQFRGFGDANKESMAELLFQFFRHYGHEFDYDTSVVSVRTGKLLTKTEKHWQLATNNMLCVEEPFNTERNLANTADDTAFRGLHLEFRQAFERISEAQDIDSRICEQFEFPEGGTRTIFERPAPQPKPILSRSQSQSGRVPRANGSTRGNRYQSTQRSGPSSRRASNPAAYNQNPQLMYAPADYMMRASPQQLSHPHSGIQDHLSLRDLSQLSQRLSHEEQRLRAQQIINAQAQLQQVQQAQAEAYASGQGRSTTLPPRQHPVPLLQTYRGSRLGSMEEPPATAPIHRIQTFSSLYDASLSMGSSSTQQGSETHTESPSTPSAPLRRQYQRAPVPATPSTSSRSQSQPPRTLSQPYTLPRGQYGAFPAMSQMQLPNGGQRQALYGPFVGPLGQYYLQAPHIGMVEQIPREYLGYGYGVPTQYMNVYTDSNVAVADGYGEERSSPSASQPLGSSVPDSWLSSRNDYDGNVDNLARSEPSSSQPRVLSGPVIVNGSSSSQHRKAETPRHSPPRRRTLDLPYRSGTTTANPGTTSSLEPYDQLATTGPRPTNGGSSVAGYYASSPQATLSADTNLSAFTYGSSATSPDVLSSSVMTMSPAMQCTSTSPYKRQYEQSTFPALDDATNHHGNSSSRAPIPPLDLASSHRDTPSAGDVPATPTTVLSPVRETNTPVESPVVSRSGVKTPAAGQTNGILPYASKAAPAPFYNQPRSMLTGIENLKPLPEQSSQPAPPPSATANRPNAANSNPWQQAVSRKKGKGKSLSVDRPRGEPMPANEAEKKGG